MIDKNFDPYDALTELQQFANTADSIISSLSDNQQQIVTAVNDISNHVATLTARIKYLEDLNAITVEE